MSDCTHRFVRGVFGTDGKVHAQCFSCGEKVSGYVVEPGVTEDRHSMSQYASKADMLQAELSAYKAMCDRLAKALEFTKDCDHMNRSNAEDAEVEAALSDYRKLKWE